MAALIFAFSFVDNTLLLPLVVFFTVAAVAASRLNPGFIIERLRFPALFITLLVIALPFISGKTPLTSFGFLTLYREGVVLSLLFTVRFLCIVTSVVVLIHTAPLQNIIRAMAALRVPSPLVNIATLLLRYLAVIRNDFQCMERSMKHRGFTDRKIRFRTFRNLAWLSGSLFVKSYDRSERVWRSMLLRGHGKQEVNIREFHPAQSSDRIMLALFLSAAATLVLLEIGLP